MNQLDRIRAEISAIVDEMSETYASLARLGLPDLIDREEWKQFHAILERIKNGKHE